MPRIDHIQPCARGYHLCREQDLVFWINEELYIAEGRGRSIRDVNKDVFEEARLICKVEKWNKKTARLFASDCAEHVLSLFEKVYPKDKRPQEAIKAARDFANGKISAAERAVRSNAALASARAAVRDSLLDKARVVARDVAVAAANSAGAFNVVIVSASAASWAVAHTVANAAKYEAREAEIKWQTQRLMEYIS